MMNLDQEKGFSLIEVLISVFVLALGFIGAAGLQLAAVRTNQQSNFHTIAVELANELADKMRTNDIQMKLSDDVNLFANINYNAVTDSAPVAPKLCYSSAASCNPTDLARADIYEWLIKVNKNLPGGRVLVCRDATPYDSDKKVLSWKCKTDPNAGLVIKIGWKSKNPDGSFVQTDGVSPPSLAITVESYVK